jgi:formylmethanofuran dehydrogenase subunit E
MPDAELLEVQPVSLSIPLEKLLSRPGYRVNCEVCGEEVINEREVVLNGAILCRACAGQSYYRLTTTNS